MFPWLIKHHVLKAGVSKIFGKWPQELLWAGVAGRMCKTTVSVLTDRANYCDTLTVYNVQYIYIFLRFFDRAS